MGSALAISIHGEKARWSDSDHLLAMAVDALNGANWQRQGKKNRPQPKQVPRPGARDQGGCKRIGSDPVTVEEFDKWLSEKRASRIVVIDVIPDQSD